MTPEAAAMNDVLDSTKMEFGSWLNSVDHILQSDYAVTIKDVGLSKSSLREIWKADETPAEYVRWFGRKYDLISQDKWLRLALKNRLTMKF